MHITPPRSSALISMGSVLWERIIEPGVWMSMAAGGARWSDRMSVSDAARGIIRR